MIFPTGWDDAPEPLRDTYRAMAATTSPEGNES